MNNQEARVAADNKVNERGGQTVYCIYSELDGKLLEGFEHRNDMI